MLVHQPRNQGDHGFRLCRPVYLLGGVVALMTLGLSIAAAEIDHSSGDHPREGRAA